MRLHIRRPIGRLEWFVAVSIVVITLATVVQIALMIYATSLGATVSPGPCILTLHGQTCQPPRITLPTTVAP